MSEAFPERLPKGERILWQGKPHWQTLARRALHLDKLTVYFTVLLAWYVINAFENNSSGNAAFASMRMVLIALMPLTLVCLYAWTCSRMTRYTLTDRRVVLTIGIAMPITFNLPFARIDAADLKMWSDNRGSITLKLAPTEHLTYLVLWPHVKPWGMAHPEPTLRCIPDAHHVAQIMSRALASFTDTPVPAAVGSMSGPIRRPIRVLA